MLFFYCDRISQVTNYKLSNFIWPWRIIPPIIISSIVPRPHHRVHAPSREPLPHLPISAWPNSSRVISNDTGMLLSCFWECWNILLAPSNVYWACLCIPSSPHCSCFLFEPRCINLVNPSTFSPTKLAVSYVILISLVLHALSASPAPQTRMTFLQTISDWASKV